MNSIKGFNEFQMRIIMRNKIAEKFTLVLIPRKEELKLGKQKNNGFNIGSLNSDKFTFKYKI